MVGGMTGSPQKNPFGGPGHFRGLSGCLLTHRDIVASTKRRTKGLRDNLKGPSKSQPPVGCGVLVVNRRAQPVALLRVPSPLVGGLLSGGGITGLLETNHDQSQDARLNFLYFSLITKSLLTPEAPPTAQTDSGPYFSPRMPTVH
jgi:hypothetical protein